MAKASPLPMAIQKHDPQKIRAICAELCGMDVGKVVRFENGPADSTFYRLRTVSGQWLRMQQASQESWRVFLISNDGTVEKAWTSEFDPSVESAAHFALIVLEEKYGEMTANYMSTVLEVKEDIQRKYFQMPIGKVAVHTRRALGRSSEVNEFVIQICETGEIRRYFSHIGRKIEFTYDVLDKLPF